MSGHLPVMLAEVLEALAPRDGAHYVDGTFGGGGYTRAILEAADCKVLGIDRDPDAIARGQALVQQFGGRLTLVQGEFSNMDQFTGASDGVVLDLGVSSFQFDQPARGFSFREDGPLDMRMSLSGMSAADFVNTTGTAYMVPASTLLIKKTISQNPILVPTKAVLAKTEFDKYLGADGTTLWSNTWTAIKAA